MRRFSRRSPLRTICACAIVAAIGAGTGASGTALDERPLQEVLTDLQASGVRLVYSTRLVTPDLRVVLGPGLPGVDRLNDSLRPLGLTLRRQADWLVVVRADGQSDAQTAVHGHVVSAESGLPLPGARIGILGAESEATADAQGRFRLPAPAGRSVALQVSHPGYLVEILEDLTVDAAHAPELVFQLVPAAPTLDEITVTPAQNPPIEIPVHVVRRGEPLLGLEAENFEVLVESERAEILDFRAVDLADDNQDPSGFVARVPSVARRHVLLLFDLTLSGPAALDHARSVAEGMLQHGVRQTDLVGVASFSRFGGAELLLGFTSDLARAATAVRAVGTTPGEQRWRQSPLPPSRSDPLQIAGLLKANGYAGPRPEVRRQEDRWAKDRLDEVFNLGYDLPRMAAESERDFTRGRVTAVYASLSELATALAGTLGHKQVIILSEGRDEGMSLGLEGATAEQREQLAAINRASTQGEVWRISSDSRYGDNQLLTDLSRVARDFQAANATVSVVELLDSEAMHGTQVTVGTPLRYLAQNTGGLVVRQVGSLEQVMTSFFETLSHVYLLTVAPPATDRSGPRSLKVKLRQVPRGTRALFPRGYSPPPASLAEGGLGSQLSTAELILGGPNGGQFGSRVAATALGRAGDPSDERTLVPVLIEIEGRELLRDFEEAKLPLEIYLYAFAQSGEIRDFDAQRLVLDLDVLAESIRAGGLRLWTDFELPAGRYLIRALTRNESNGYFSISTAELQIPRFDESSIFMLPLLFPQAQRSWVTVPLTAEPASGRVLEEITGRRLLPTASPHLEAGTVTPIVMVGLNLPPGDVVLWSRLYTPGGNLVEEQRTPAEGLTSAAGLRSLVGGLDCHVAPGDYRLVVVLERPGSHEVGATATADVRIVEAADPGAL